MLHRSIRLVILVLSGLVVSTGFGLCHSAVAGQLSAAGVSRQFMVFDATLYRNKPSLREYDVHPLSILYEDRFWPPGSPHSDLPPEELVRSLAKHVRITPEPVVIDIERWPLKGNDSTVRSTIGKILLLLSWLRSEAPNVKLGFYGTLPLPDYWRAIRDSASSEHRSWQRDNDRLDDIGDRVDALFPSIYTFYPDRQGWVEYAVAQLTEARRKAKGKPVYAFLWPQYHESNFLAGLWPLEPDYWELQLNTVYQYADGVVIWGGWGSQGPEAWDEEAPWWQVTQRFLRRIHQLNAASPAGAMVEK
jgi:hypothetical protein